MTLPDIQSGFVKSIVEKQGVIDARFRLYIQDLVKLEGVVTAGGPKTKAEGISFYFLKTKYHEEYRKILKELAPQRKYSDIFSIAEGKV